MAKANSDLRSLNRLVDILNCFSETEPAMTLTEVSRCIKLPKSTTFRFLEAMTSQGLLMPDPNGKGYRLGYVLIHWGILAQSSIDIRNDALPFLRSLADCTGETAILSARYGNVGAWIEMIESRHPVRLAMKIGQPLQLHAGASSKVLIAFLSDSEQHQVLSEIQLNPLQKNTITNRDQLLAELRDIRERGYATSFEETDNGAMGVAAPVYDHTGQVVCGIGIVAPAVRVTQERVPEVATQVVNTAQALSRRLGALHRSSI
ncbi:MAG: IclR family transcriptional regulator [Anaerolineaceae bacterium]|nr:IclR family transcriptional regulator [Anaerolineaceae bacterium]